MRSIIEYTEQEIDELGVGPEVRRLVCCDVLGMNLASKKFGRKTGYRYEMPDGTPIYGSASFFGWGYNESEEAAAFHFPQVDSDISAAYPIGERMAGLGLKSEYGKELEKTVWAHYEALNYFLTDRDFIFEIAHASPLQRCKAALKAVRAQRLREVKE